MFASGIQKMDGIEHMQNSGSLTMAALKNSPMRNRSNTQRDDRDKLRPLNREDSMEEAEEIEEEEIRKVSTSFNIQR